MIVGVLGCGNMGGAIAIGFHGISGYDVVVYDRNERNRRKMSNAGIKMYDSVEQLAQGCDVLILAVQPVEALPLLERIEPARAFKQLISVVAAVSLADLQLRTRAQVARAMPNVACARHRSTTLITPGAEIFEKLGAVFPMPESAFDAGSVLCSCQTAFAMRYARAAQIAGIAMGINADDALKITAHCMREAMEDVLQGADPDAQTNAVMTPGGWTAKGICELEAHGFTNAVVSGLRACK